MKFITQTLTLILLILVMPSLQAQKKTLHHTELAKYLPASVKGYIAINDESEGGTIESNGMSYSTASQEYKKGDVKLTLVIIDYSESEQIYQATTMPWAMGMSVDTNEERANSIQVDGFDGWEVYHKKDKDANIVLGVHKRYIFSAQCTDCNTQLLKEVVKSLNLRKLPQ